MRIFYLSSVDVFDSDMNILPHLSKEHDITLGMLVPRPSRNYWEKELKPLIEGNRRLQCRPSFLKARRRSPRNMGVYIRLIATIRKGKYDLVYLNDFEDIYFRALFVAFVSKRRTVFGIHDVLYHSGWVTNLLLRTSREVFRRKFDTVLTFSRSQGKLLEKKCRRVFSVPLALKNFGPQPWMKKDYGIIQFLFFGNIASYKGLDILIKAVKKLSLRHDNFRLTIAGRGDDWEPLYAPLIADCKNIVADIRFIENAEIPYYFAFAHYLILPYRDVTQSGPLMIAYNYQVPVIASDLEGFREYIKEGTTGFTFETGDGGELEQLLESAVQRKKEDYDHLVGNLKDFVLKEHAGERIARRYDEIFREVYEESIAEERQKMSFFRFIFQDWQANKSNPKGRIIMLLFRIANFCSTRKIYSYLGLPYLVFYKILVEWFFSVEIPWNVKIGRNLVLFHGQCLVMNSEVVIGENCILRHCTTIGNKQLKKGGFSGSPVIGDNVDMGSNVSIIGDILVGNNVKIGCGAVVTRCVSDNDTVVGNPADSVYAKERFF